MARTFSGELTAKGLKVAIVVSRFNEFITGKLLAGAEDELVRHGVLPDDIDVFWVPGSFEIPAVAARLAEKNYGAVICVGAVIRGSTPHFEYVAAEVSKGVAQVAIKAKMPVTFGVLTTDNIEQAIERAGAKAGNKGADAARAAIEMANLYAKLSAK